MFSFSVEKEQWAIKPMNCPGHCLMFKKRERSYRELPLRLADFGVLHRNEASGALGGLTRVRKFQQDDAHIFCTIQQLDQEISSCLDFLVSIYGIYGFDFSFKLSTRPQAYIGELATWNKAEEILSNALNKYGYVWTLNEGDGAFYGPKIDVSIMDAMRRRHQCGTIQLDFHLPERFNLLYRSSSKTLERPVMLHRAIMGSVERFLAIITEHFKGKWPFWLSPRQVMVIPIGPSSEEYAKEVAQKLYDAGLEAEADLSSSMFNKKVRNAQIEQWNYAIIVGDKEVEEKKVSIRARDAGKDSSNVVLPLDEAINEFIRLKKTRTLSSDIGRKI